MLNKVAGLGGMFAQKAEHPLLDPRELPGTAAFKTDDSGIPEYTPPIALRRKAFVVDQLRCVAVVGSELRALPVWIARQGQDG